MRAMKPTGQKKRPILRLAELFDREACRLVVHEFLLGRIHRQNDVAADGERFGDVPGLSDQSLLSLSASSRSESF